LAFAQRAPSRTRPFDSVPYPIASNSPLPRRSFKLLAKRVDLLKLRKVPVNIFSVQHSHKYLNSTFILAYPEV
jgi:hypothetical protein